jgi:hypothetical protein
MALVEQALFAGVIATVQLDAPTGQILVTQTYAGTAAEIYVTVDGSKPVLPDGAAEVPTGQRVIAAVIGARISIRPPEQGYPRNYARVNLLSSGTPTVSVEW